MIDFKNGALFKLQRDKNPNLEIKRRTQGHLHSHHM